MDGNLAKTPLVDLLRHIDLGASAEITEPSGWSYFTNIGNLTHMAADELDKKEEELAAYEHLAAVARDVNEWLKTIDMGGTGHQRSLEAALAEYDKCRAA